MFTKISSTETFGYEVFFTLFIPKEFIYLVLKHQYHFYILILLVLNTQTPGIKYTVFYFLFILIKISKINNNKRFY